MNRLQNWHVLYTKPNCEQKVAHLLTQRGFTNYCPQLSVASASQNQERLAKIPLFTSFVFVYCREADLTEIKNFQHIINILYWRNKPAVVQKEEVATIKYALSNYEGIKAVKTGCFPSDDVVQLQPDALTFSLPSIGFKLVAQAQKEAALESQPALIRRLNKEKQLQRGRTLQSFFSDLPYLLRGKALKMP